MSYSNKNASFDSPVVTDIEWAGGIKKGYLKRYDRENKCDVPFEGSFGFMELDTRTAVKGFSKANMCGIFSNEVNNQSEEELEVFSFNNGKKVSLQVHNPVDNTYIDIKPGLYKDMKISLKAAGGKYTSVVYAIVTTSSDPLAKVGSLVRIYVNGSMLSSYFDNAKQGYEILVDPSKRVQKTVGDNTFWTPSLELKPISAEQDKAAMDADEVLQKFFVGYAESKLDSVEGTHVQSAADQQAENDASIDGAPKPSGDIEEDVPF